MSRSIEAEALPERVRSVLASPRRNPVVFLKLGSSLGPCNPDGSSQTAFVKAMQLRRG